MIPEGEPHLTACQNDILKLHKPEEQNNTFWFPTPNCPDKPEDHTPRQTRIIRNLLELKAKEKINPQDETESCEK